MENPRYGPYVLHNAETTTARGNIVPCGGMGTVGVQIADSLDGTFEIYFEATVDGTNWETLYGVAIDDGMPYSSAEAPGLYLQGIGGFSQFSARIDSITDASITCTAFLWSGQESSIADWFEMEMLFWIAMFLSGMTVDTDDVTITHDETIWGVNDVSETVANVTYVGKEKATGYWPWWIMKIDTTAGTSITHAGGGNNYDVFTYDDAWAAKETTLVFGPYSEAM